MPDLAHIAQDIASKFVPAYNSAHSRIAEADTVQQLLEAVEAGNYIETAAELAGLSKVTVYSWLKRGEAGETPYDLLANALKRASARAEAAEVTKVRTAGNDPRFWAASMTYLERRHPERWARRQDGNDGPKVVVQIGVRDSDVQVVVQAASQGNVISNYQTQMLGESESNQLLPAPCSGANEAKVGGESEI
jgi:hypothetical protein